MKFRAVGVALTLTGLLLAVAPGMAHHEILAKFDDTKPVTLKGIVTLVDWANPHVHVFMNVTTGKQLVNWAVELESPIDLQQSGWSADSVQPGDAIGVVAGTQMASGSTNFMRLHVVGAPSGSFGQRRAGCIHFIWLDE